MAFSRRNGRYALRLQPPLPVVGSAFDMTHRINLTNRRRAGLPAGANPTKPH
jgi:hypothetical protein